MAYRTCGFVKFSKFWTDERAANRKRKERKCDICRLWNYKKLIKVVSELWKLQIRKTFLYEAWLEHTCTTKKNWIWALWHESHIRGVLILDANSVFEQKMYLVCLHRNIWIASGKSSLFESFFLSSDESEGEFPRSVFRLDIFASKSTWRIKCKSILSHIFHSWWIKPHPFSKLGRDVYSSIIIFNWN